MKLKRSTASNIFSCSSEGLWQSDDGEWVFSKGIYFPYSHPDIQFTKRSWFITSGKVKGYEAKEGLLKSVGLWKTPFKTRREAVSALNSALEGLA
jgi:hypothetical protein